MAGGFLGYGSEIKTLGLGVNAEFPIIENLTIAPNFTYFLPKEESSIVKTTIFEFNANANYYFLNDDAPFAELKYVVSDFDQFVLLAGVKFNL